MVETVIWLKKAEKILDQIVDYLESEQSVTTAQNFVREIYSAIDLLVHQPMIGRESGLNQSIRFVLVGRHRRLYYRLRDKKLIIVFLFDTRQSPDKDPYR